MIVLYSEERKRYLGMNFLSSTDEEFSIKDFMFVSDKELAVAFSSRRMAQYVANKWAWCRKETLQLIGETEKDMFLSYVSEEKGIFIKKNEQSNQYEITDKMEEALMFDDCEEAWEVAYECAYLGLGKFYVFGIE
ncbi:hypothetical protein IL099_002863 [Enterococcus hirae]|nr:hypothetical protein [Enterococcus hirae]